MKRIVLAAVVLFGIGCAHGTSPSPAATTSPVADATETAASPEPAASAVRTLRATGHDARVTLQEGPGFLVDGNAPPPPPGTAIARHPAVGGSCMGAPAGCSRAGTAVRSATTFADVVRALEAAGFVVDVE